MIQPRSHRHERALRAALAVTLGGVACTSRAADPDERDRQNAETERESEALLEGSAEQALDPHRDEPLPLEGSARVPGSDAGSNHDGPSTDRVVTPRPAEGSANGPIPLDPDGAAAADGSGDAEKCSAERDGQCPVSCDRNTDADCCEGPDSPGGGFCTFTPGYGCQCAVIGPFNPPETPA